MIPGLEEIFNANPVATGSNLPITEPTLGGVLSGLFNVALLIAGFLMFIWIIWGVYQYIFAGGNKDGLAKARSRIIWAIVGFIILLLAFAISQFFQEVINPADPPIKDITKPT